MVRGHRIVICGKRSYWSVGVTLMLVVGLLQDARATRFQAGLDESNWVVQSSLFECSMTHNVPYYGDAVFAHKAGAASSFRLHSSTPRFATGKASLVSAAPQWKPGVKPIDLGYVPVKQGDAPVALSSKQAERLLAELFAGREVVFTRAPWYGASESSRVVLSNVNFQPAYRQYLGCLAQLLPVSFEQIERTAIYFPSGQHMLEPSELRKLDNIAIYVKADSSVEAFFIDGHTDSQGNREENLELSRQRAEMVAEMLVKRGIPAERITSRWHGERYPVANNRNASGRAKNRRVTIRLEKGGAPQLPPLASAPAR